MEIVVGVKPEPQQTDSGAVLSAARLRGEFPSSRNGSTATIPTRLTSSSSGPRSDAVVILLDVFVIQACFVLCVPDSVPMLDAVYVFMLVDIFILCYV